MEKYEAIIGLEIHAELMTKSKMFTSAPVVDSVEAEPNTAVHPLCLGMPGTLPVINKQAVDYALRVALALNCTINQHNIFARKNYFYPDLPKGYQISQYEEPIGVNGHLDIGLADGRQKRICIRRVHMEEDTGKLTHQDDGTSLVDYNRAGVPLLEIVTEPDIHSGEEARTYAMKIRQILRYLGVNSGDMEKGVLRVEPNISIRPAGSAEFGTRTELKNLNSFKVLGDGTAYEIQRQIQVVTSGGQVVQETRGWNEDKKYTFSQRVKEEAEDYCYFPEPDLPPLFISEEWIAETKAALPELPDAKIQRYVADLHLTDYEAQVLSEERAVGEWLDTAVAAGGNPKSVSKWMINELFRLMNEHKQTIKQIQVTPAGLVELIGLVEKNTLNNNIAKEVLADMFMTGQSAANIVQVKGLAQISDEAALAALVSQILADNPEMVSRYVAGEGKLRGWFVGQVMQQTKGKANPKLVNQLLGQQLATRDR
ncbi:MAG: Asp-tRNA(Asn)/Glu-tRNA(Gln) amidotransferase subunit GatB [Chloroflexi bacterium]|nr:Asp-tRNA(Asn)/Glu-tRNA(Gln) amidotransferase subunit GatB [Chloroflexota bacterium]